MLSFIVKVTRSFYTQGVISSEAYSCLDSMHRNICNLSCSTAINNLYMIAAHVVVTSRNPICKRKPQSLLVLHIRLSERLKSRLIVCLTHYKFILVIPSTSLQSLKTIHIIKTRVFSSQGLPICRIGSPYIQLFKITSNGYFRYCIPGSWEELTLPPSCDRPPGGP